MHTNWPLESCSPDVEAFLFTLTYKMYTRNELLLIHQAKQRKQSPSCHSHKQNTYRARMKRIETHLGWTKRLPGRTLG